MKRHALVLVAHGTADPHGQETVRRLRAQVQGRLPGVHVVDAYVDVQQPALDDVVDALVRAGFRTTIVPLLLSTGYHTEVDVARAAARSPLVTAAPPLGPHPVLADIVHDRLREAGAAPGAPVVLAAAGSSRPEAADAVREVATHLRSVHDGTVIAGFAAAQAPSVATAMLEADRGDADVWVASYLLGRGFFHDLLGRSSPRVTDPIGADPRVAQLVCDRYAAIVAPAGPVAWSA